VVRRLPKLEAFFWSGRRDSNSQPPPWQGRQFGQFIGAGQRHRLGLLSPHGPQASRTRIECRILERAVTTLADQAPEAYWNTPSGL